MVKKKWITIMIAACFSFMALGVLSACAGEKGEQGEQGIQGIQGEAGKDGVTPTLEISQDGYWIINGVKTEYKAIGQDGENGNNGLDGSNGQNGDNGENGRGIESVYYNANGDLVIVYTDKTEQTITLPIHTHVESEWIVDTEPTCGAQGLQHKECTGCHAFLKSEVIPSKGGHVYGQGICSVCGDFQTQGLVFSQNEDKESFDVFIGKCTDSKIYIPAYYKEKPVIDVNFEFGTGDVEFVKEIYIPNTVKDFGFLQCPNLEKVIIEDNSSLEKISIQAFYKCPNLKEIDFGENSQIRAIEDWAFYGCSNLKSIILPETVTKIGRETFGKCDSLTEIAIPDSVESIDNGAFFQCKNLTTVQLSNSLKTMGESVFEESGILSLTIPASVETFKASAFSGCKALKTVSVAKESKLQNIYQFAFYNCSTLENIVFGENSKLEFIGNSSFYGCDSLKFIDIPEGVKRIDYAAFEGCSSLRSVRFPTTLQTLSSHSFYGCETLSEITIPVATTSIMHTTFTGCDALMKITVEQGNTVYHSSGNCIIETSKKKLLIGCTGSVLPQDGSVTEIGAWAFGENSCLKKIEISEYITKIDIMAFYNCGGLENIIVNENNPVFHENGNCLINTEEKRILRLCSNSVIPSDGSVTKIQDGAFSGCTIQKLYIPACIEVVTVSSHNIIGLESIIVEAGNTKYYSAGDCLISKDTETLYIGCKNSVIPSGVKKIKSYAFEGCEITSLNIPVSVTEIETFALLDCTLLKEIRYEGTKAQWALLEKGGSWDSNTGDYIVICADGILSKV